MNPKPEKPKQETLSPKTLVRVTMWCGIYLCAAVFFAENFQQSLARLNIPIWGTIGFTILIFPCGLGFGVSQLIVPMRDGLPNHPFLWEPLCALAYIFYVVHLWFTWNAKTKQAFRIVMVVFIVIVSLNLASCVKLMQKQNGAEETSVDQSER